MTVGPARGARHRRPGVTLPRSQPLPGPAAPFLGRDREVAALRRLLIDIPVVAITGPPGIGKTALALAALAQGDAPPLYVPLRGETRALDADWRAGLLAQAESSGATVLLDGLEASHPDRDALLLALAGEARRSRWVVTARAIPDGPPARLPLRPLDPVAARALAIALGAAEASVDWAVATSRGAPGRLLRVLSPRSAALPFDLPAAWHPWLVRLAAVSSPVLRSVLAAFDPQGIDAAIAEGVVSQVLAGLMLDPVVRDDVRETLGPLDAADKRAFAEVLSGVTDKTSPVNAVELWLQLGDFERARRELDAQGEAVLDGRFVAVLWDQLRPVTAPALRRWRFRAAVAAGVVGEVDADELPDDDLAIRCDRARLLSLRGQSEAARDAADAVLAAFPDHAGTTAFRAAMVSAGASLNLRHGARALAVLELITPTNDVEALDHAVVKAKAFAAEQREVEGCAVLTDIRALIARIGLPLPKPTTARLAGACIDLDDRALARRILPDPVANAHSAYGPDVTHTIDVVHACLIALDDGRLEDVALFAELQASLPVQSSVVSTHERLIRAEWLVDVGRFAEALAPIAAVGDRVDRSDNADWMALLNAQVALATGVPARGFAPPQVSAEGVAAVGEIARMRYGLRWGAGPFERLPSATDIKPRTRRCLPLQLRAEHHLLHGRAEDASYDAARACREAEQAGYRVHLADALHTEADVRCVVGDRGGCRAAAGRLVAQGRRISSPRYEREGSWYAAALDHDWATLEALAAAPEPAPIAARRAAALLGEAPLLDALDQRVVAALTAGAWPIVTAGAGDGGGWGVDLVSERVWGDGAWVAIDPHTNGWRLLQRLAAEGGYASNAALLEAVWQIDRYRPHQHDNRLQVAVHRLRHSIGGVDADPRIVRRPDGYALAGRFRIVAPGTVGL